MKNLYKPLREAAALGRTMLTKAASNKWKIPMDQCKVDFGKIINTKTGEMFTYAQLVADAIKLRKPLLDVTLKTPDQFRYMGKEFIRIDMKDKSMGKALFTMDIYPKDILYATVSKPKVAGAKVKSFDQQALKTIEGFVDTVKLNTGMAFIAKTMESALKAKELANVVYENSNNKMLDNTKLKEELNNLFYGKGKVAQNIGMDIDKALESADTRLHMKYQMPYLQHMLMEPLTCIADVKEDRCIVYSGTQNQTGCMDAAKQITGLSEDKIDIRTMYLGTGFGRRAYPDFTAETLLLSKAMKRPVKLIYDRESEIYSDRLRPANAHKIDIGLKNGKIAAWNHKIASGSIQKELSATGKVDSTSTEGIVGSIYSFDNKHVELADYDSPFPCWYWRSVGHSQNAFVMETMMDELAFLAGKDAVEFRLEYLKKNTRAVNLLKEVAIMSQWDKKPAIGQAKGCAIHYCFGSYVAHVVEISVDQSTGEVHVDKVDCAIDMGPFTVHKDSVVAQIEGGTMFGISAALHEEVRIKNGGFDNDNFDTYPVARMIDSPSEINVKIINSDTEPGGIGELAVPTTAPAIVNALYKITGERVYSLPLKAENILAAIKKNKNI